MGTLYEMTGRWAAIKAAAMDPNADTAALRRDLDTVEGEIREKADNYCRIVADLNADAVTAREEASRLMARAKTYESRAVQLRQWLLEAMKATGQESMRTPLFHISVAPTVPSVKVTDLEAALNSGYLKAPRYDETMLDKAAMRRDMEAGKEIPGVELVQGETLRVR